MTDDIFQNVLRGGRRGSEQHPKLPAQHPPYIIGEASPDRRFCPLSRAGVSYLGAGSCCPAKTTFHFPPEDQSLSSAEPWETPRFKFIFLIFLKLLFISNTTSSCVRQYKLNPETAYGVQSVHPRLQLSQGQARSVHADVYGAGWTWSSTESTCNSELETNSSRKGHDGYGKVKSHQFSMAIGKSPVHRQLPRSPDSFSPTVNMGSLP